ncbi:hypothetical protein CH253_04055 [Rhodococcus sp. 06-156-3C]|uniref:hypothetical protein n=1 Tax=Nocardiaceae TaxID=85025 RepID=UPI00052300D9|nr:MULTISPECIES: hypothetical protein [Rhodococcus]OZD17766.1 hypothetical protein CH280_08030 [Rhodococcus sp. 06-156-4C]OZD21433.1 hypothetical protein CH248_09990 [Rhodococcus sp. 06-156-4a]OZD24020.1 hypothetical protein CH247_29020 [Rhodococcus sp. 06-156-3b]OZD25193.1 hypothetical protein CH253_04055 [Rhodococcus sp. 06-156-3C]OZD40137.1 hypothetical protein CH284_03780 [Rhodococcus sp. 06-156-3]
MNGKMTILGLAPWALFAILTERMGASAVGIAALLACVSSLALAFVGRSTSVARGNGGIKIIDAAGIVTFGIIAVLGFLGNSSLNDALADFGRGGATFVLAAVMAVSVVTVPFTEQYARDSVDPQYWGTPRFHEKNKSISAMWAGVVFAMAVCHVIAGALASSTEMTNNHPGNLLLNWVVPIALIVWAVKRTGRIAGDHSATPNSATPQAT